MRKWVACPCTRASSPSHCSFGSQWAKEASRTTRNILSSVHSCVYCKGQYQYCNDYISEGITGIAKVHRWAIQQWIVGSDIGGSQCSPMTSYFPSFPRRVEDGLPRAACASFPEKTHIASPMPDGSIWTVSSPSPLLRSPHKLGPTRWLSFHVECRVLSTQAITDCRRTFLSVGTTDTPAEVTMLVESNLSSPRRMPPSVFNIRLVAVRRSRWLLTD